MKFVFIVLGLRIEMIWIVIFDEIIYWFWIEEKKKEKKKKRKIFFYFDEEKFIKDFSFVVIIYKMRFY